MGVVVGYEMLPDAQNILFGSRRFWQCTANEVVDAVAHHRRIVLDGVGRVARQFQRVVARIAQVVDGVEQRAV